MAQAAQGASDEGSAEDAAGLARTGQDLLTQGRLVRAANLAARACALDPLDPEALCLAADVARAEGDLAGAAEAYALWRDSDPADANAAYAAALFAGETPPPEPAGCTPAAFVVEENLLSGVQQEMIGAYLLANLGEMEAASVVQSGESQEDATSRSAHVLYDPEPVEAWFSPFVAAYLPWALPRLGLAPFDVSQVELQLTASYHGDFYHAHHDITLGEADSVAGRKVSFVYYYHLTPAAFAGGALRLYDHYPGEGTHTRERYTTVLPLANRLVLFRSEALHEVMPVVAPGGQAEAGRFTLNGWLHGAGAGGVGVDDRLPSV
ncbi:MAG: hypothetical protein Kilf2KO_31050 [Rhodospirillales bacterium]